MSMHTILNIAGAWLLADFITGIVHWAEDTYFNSASRFQIVNRIIAENNAHHADPTAMLKGSYWSHIRDSLLVAVPISLLVFALGGPQWLYLGVFFSGFGNLVHRFAHEPQAKIPKVVRLLQRLGVMISPRNHNSHHWQNRKLVTRAGASRMYCPMTGYLNPLLDRLRLWEALERLLPANRL